MQGFSGFPAGKQPVVRIPNTFFTELLPAIDDLAELKVTLYCLWILNHKQGELRYTRLAEIEPGGLQTSFNPMSYCDLPTAMYIGTRFTPFSLMELKRSST